MLPNIDKTPKFNDKKVKVLWAGREMALKHPEYAFYAAEILYSLNIPYQVSIVSTQNDVLKTLISQNQNKPYFKNINIIDPVSNSEMHNILFASDIFIFSSDKNEGWGAIVNEAMSNGCCVIASNKAGCTNFLIKNQINGLIFDSKDEFKEQILYALKENNFIELGKNAQKTIKDVWNSNKAVINLMQIFDAILNKEKISENLTNKGPGTLII